MVWLISGKHAATHMCFHAGFGRSALNGVGINTREPRKWAALELRAPGIGGVAGPKIHAPPHLCYHVKYDSTATKGERINRRNPQIGERWAPDPLGWGVADPWKQAASPRVLWR